MYSREGSIRQYYKPNKAVMDKIMNNVSTVLCGTGLILSKQDVLETNYWPHLLFG